eukprot:7386965-Lingulodinium_polyedra.AAC.1
MISICVNLVTVKKARPVGGVAYHAAAVVKAAVVEAVPSDADAVDGSSAEDEVSDSGSGKEAAVEAEQPSEDDVADAVEPGLFAEVPAGPRPPAVPAGRLEGDSVQASDP